MKHLFPQISLNRLAITSLVIVACGYSLLTVSVRFLNVGFQPMTQVYVRVGLAAIILMALFRKRLRWKHMFAMPMKDMLTLLVMGTVGFSVAVYLITLGAINAKIVNVSIIFATQPFFSYIYAYVFLRKKINGKLILFLLLSMLGIAIVATKSFVPHLESFGKGEWFTLLATATMATYYVGRKVLSTHLNTSEITVIGMSIAAVSGCIIAIARGETLPLGSFGNPTVILGLIIAVGMNVLVNPLEIFSFNHLDAVVGSQILLLDSIFSLLFGYLFFREVITLPEIVGGLIIIGSVYVANIYTVHET